MAAVDLVDETYLAVSRVHLAAVVHDERHWGAWWPDLRLSVFMDRGLDGIRWSVSGAWTGSAEIWLERVGDGVVLHHYLRLDPADPVTGAARHEPVGRGGRRRAARERDRRARAWKRHAWALKDDLEKGRPAGMAPGPE